MDENKLVSIIVPCYKQANLLPETLNSILAQTYSNWECIVVNDGSPDNTKEVAKKFCNKDQRIKLLNQDNAGLAMARNNGIKVSTGDFILPLDSDDLIDPTYLEKALKRFVAYPETKLVYCKADRFDEKNEKWDLPQYSYDNELWENSIFCSAIYRKSDYQKTIGYNPNMKGGYEDWDFWLSLLNENDIVYQIPEILFHYRYQKNSMVSKTNQVKENLYIQLFNNHKEKYLPYCENIITYKRNSDRFNKLCSKKVIRILLNSNVLKFFYSLFS